MPFSVGSFPNGEDDKGKKFWTNLNFSQIINQIVKGGWFDDNYINTCAFLVRAKLHLADRCSLGRLHSPIYNALLVSFSSVLLSKKSCSWNVKTPHATSTQFLLCNDQLSRNLLFKLYLLFPLPSITWGWLIWISVKPHILRFVYALKKSIVSESKSTSYWYITNVSGTVDFSKGNSHHSLPMSHLEISQLKSSLIENQGDYNFAENRSVKHRTRPNLSTKHSPSDCGKDPKLLWFTSLSNILLKVNRKGIVNVYELFVMKSLQTSFNYWLLKI